LTVLRMISWCYTHSRKERSRS